MASATGLVAHARATARTAVGRPIALATSAYDRVSPYGIAPSAFQTCHWNDVAWTSRGRSSRGCRPVRWARIRVVHFASAPSSLAIVAAGYSRAKARSSSPSAAAIATARTPGGSSLSTDRAAPTRRADNGDKPYIRCARRRPPKRKRRRGRAGVAGSHTTAGSTRRSNGPRTRTGHRRGRRAREPPASVPNRRALQVSDDVPYPLLCTTDRSARHPRLAVKVNAKCRNAIMHAVSGRRACSRFSLVHFCILAFLHFGILAFWHSCIFAVFPSGLCLYAHRYRRKRRGRRVLRRTLGGSRRRRRLSRARAAPAGASDQRSASREPEGQSPSAERQRDRRPNRDRDSGRRFLHRQAVRQ